MLRTTFVAPLTALAFLLLPGCGEDRPDIGASTGGNGTDSTAEQWRQLGLLCEGNEDCAITLSCSANADAQRADGQCSVGCATDDECQEHFGDNSHCFAEASVCVRACTDSRSCPRDTFCASDGWCERPGPATADAYCGGTPTAQCSDMTDSTCTTLRGCGLTGGGCTGTEVDVCGTHSSAFDCAQQMGCAWDAEIEACVGYPEPLPCASAPTPTSCKAARGRFGNCSWTDGNCAGTSTASCPGVGIADCAQVAGCEVVSP